ncbi:MAG: hypothetical protein JXQ85_02070 [Cognatishimia sp.]|uniref:hypothetical protein n=1 Tax=Cognatishimia sp. TaxID=2211648 RepID=UPI003B8B301B
MNEFAKNRIGFTVLAASFVAAIAPNASAHTSPQRNDTHATIVGSAQIRSNPQFDIATALLKQNELSAPATKLEN